MYVAAASKSPVNPSASLRSTSGAPTAVLVGPLHHPSIAAGMMETVHLIAGISLAHRLHVCVAVQCDQYRESILLDPNWEKAHFAFGRYLDQLYTDAKQREVRGG